MKKKIILLFKLLIVFLIFLYLFKTEKLTIQSLSFFINEPFYSLIIFIIMICLSVPIVSIRWIIILHKMKFSKQSFYKIFCLTMISQFFAIFLPGAPTSDLTKGYYLHNEKTGKTKIYLSILIDRLTGLYGIIIIFIFLYIYNYDFLTKNIYVSYFGNFLIFVFILSNLIFFTIRKKMENYINNINKNFVINKLILILRAIDELDSETFIKAIGISIINQIFLIFMFLILNYYFVTKNIVELISISTLIPIGEITSVIPVAPIGIGIGHISFEKLFNLYNFQNGANVFNTFILLKILLGLFGGFFYIFYTKQEKKNTSQDVR